MVYMNNATYCIYIFRLISYDDFHVHKLKTKPKKSIKATNESTRNKFGKIKQNQNTKFYKIGNMKRNSKKNERKQNFDSI